MTEMIRRYLRQKLASPGIVVALGVITLVTAFRLAVTGGKEGLETGFVSLLLLAAASVSKDASGGALQMILARPLTRTDYLFGRYLGILAAYASFLAACALVAFALATVFLPMLGLERTPVSAPALLRGFGGGMLGVVLPAAILLFFSTFLPGYADVLAYFLLMIALPIPALLGQALRKPGLERVSELAKQNVLPEVRWDQVLQGQDALGAATGRWVLAVTVFLVAAAVVFSRREFAYGQD